MSALPSVRIRSVLAAVALAACDDAHSPPTSAESQSTTPPEVRAVSGPAAAAAGGGFQRDFDFDACTFASRGVNPYFRLQPGFTLVLAGESDGARVRLRIRVLNETEQVAGVTTRVVEERETEDGELVEVSRNFFALCKEHNSVVYFGEDVDNYEDGELVNHDGSWRAGVNGAEPGIVMAGLPLLGARYFQEIAPGVALDRAEVVEVDAAVRTPLRTFEDVLVTEESTPLEPGVRETKAYAAGVGQIRDADLRLVRFGFDID
jgi:hypothetical protein